MKNQSPTISDTSSRETGTSPELEQVRQFWDQNPLFAGELDETPGERAFFKEHARIAIEEHSGAVDQIFLRDVLPGREVLDVGCGIGFWVHQFCMRGTRVSACDLTDTAVALTQKRMEMFGLSAQVRQGNAEDLPYPDGSFDHVNCQGVIHHTPNTAACIPEFQRVLRPGGTLCFSVYYKTLVLRWKPLYRFVSWITRPWLGMRGRGREKMMAAREPEELVRLYDGSANPIGKAYTRGELHAMLAGHFEVLEERRFGFPRRVFPFPIPTPLHRVLSRVFGLMIILRCRRVGTTPAVVGSGQRS
jgi:2-polyprenyl-3-methyl-5-hydroxy-6-metoxy-1,4-benzoquinol methylase